MDNTTDERFVTKSFDLKGADGLKLEDGWKEILNYGKSEDERMLDEWKDELANLLTFTGLFSAVVTGFIVLTLPMLQQDPATASTILLAQISQQLSSLSVGSHFINSTFQPSNTANAVPFVPDSRVVQLNILWVTSLTLAVMAAFFTIAVQQWIRRVPLPSDLPLRDTLRLWHVRHVGLINWKVPSIISLLPVVVQVSVVLFLVGLYFLLESLHHTTALVLLILGCCLLGLFMVSTILPLVSRTCPYRSPVVPAFLTIIQICAVPVFMLIGFFMMLVGTSAEIICSWIIPGPAYVALVSLDFILDFIRFRLLSKLVANRGYSPRPAVQWTTTFQYFRLRVGNFNFVFARWSLAIFNTVLGYIFSPDGTGTLWSRMELLHASKNSEQIDCQALSWACSGNMAMWRQHPELLDKCLKDIPPNLRPSVGVSTLHRTLMSHYHDVSMTSPPISHPVFPLASLRLAEAVSDAEDLLWRTLPDTWVGDGVGKPAPRDLVYIVCLLYRNNVLGLNTNKLPTTSSRTAMAQYLVKIRATQSAKNIFLFPDERFPTILLFGCCVRGYRLTKSDTLKSFQWARELIEQASASNPTNAKFKVPLHDALLGSLAMALMGCASDHQSDTDSAPVAKGELFWMVEACFGVLRRHRQAFLRRTCIVAHFPADKHVLITAHALTSIANSIARLAFFRLLAMDPDCPSYKVMKYMEDMCNAAHEDELGSMREFIAIFQRFTAGSDQAMLEIPAQYLCPTTNPTDRDCQQIVEPRNQIGLSQDAMIMN